MDKYTGKKLDGRYEIRELIGVGGMANVYHCYDTIDAREVAIKILKDEFLDNEDFIRRFKNESKAIAVLNHPNIVRVYDVSFGDMIQYIVMEYIDGITLKEYIDMQGVLDWKETVHLTTQILKALQHAHENGIVHRDIKPHNIMLLQDGTIKVTDFGIARFSSNATRTMTEQAIGSVHYIAPEQARGEKTDGKTDIYSVGVMMYEMLTGKLPFDGDSAVSVALMQLQANAKRPREINPDIPEGLEEITMKAMQKNPNNRYRSAVEMLSDIERFRLNPGIRFNYRYAAEKKQHNPDPQRKQPFFSILRPGIGRLNFCAVLEFGIPFFSIAQLQTFYLARFRHIPKFRIGQKYRLFPYPLSQQNQQCSADHRKNNKTFPPITHQALLPHLSILFVLLCLHTLYRKRPWAVHGNFLLFSRKKQIQVSFFLGILDGKPKQGGTKRGPRQMGAAHPPNEQETG